MNGLWDRPLEKCQAAQADNTFIKILKKRVIAVIEFSVLLNKQTLSASASCEKNYIIPDEFNIIGMKSTYVLYKSRRV